MPEKNEDVVDDLFQSANMLRSIFMKIAKDKSENVNLLHSHHAILGILMKKGPMNMSEIGNVLCISKSNLTPVVDHLAGENLVERKFDDSDRRIIKIELTEKGRNTIKKAKESVKEEFCVIINNLGKKDREKLFESVRNMKEIISKINLSEKKK